MPTPPLIYHIFFTFARVNFQKNSQLLGVLVESIFDREKAKKRYENLKQTKLYDNEKEQWNWSISKDQTIRHTDRSSRDQLLGVWVEKMFEEDEGLTPQDEPVPVVRRF